MLKDGRAVLFDVLVKLNVQVSAGEKLCQPGLAERLHRSG